jgi:ribosome maturation factor RimP
VSDPLPGAYRLEVSSPGLDRPLAKPEHFRRFLGVCARVTLYAPIEGRRRFTGVLYGFDDEGVRVACKDGTVTLPYAAIAKARLVPEFD